MSDLPRSLASFSGVVRLFPLPNFVLFPGVVQPFHIFEPRYRAMLLDALAGDKLIAMAHLLPGWENQYEGRPPVFDVVCVGKILTHTPLEDERHNILLTGMARARIVRELPGDKPFRLAEATLIPEQSEVSPTSLTLRRHLLEACRKMAGSLTDSADAMEQFLSSQAELGQIADVLSFALKLAPADKQALLAEPDAAKRARKVLTELRSLAALHQAGPPPSGDKRFPPDFSVN